MKETRTLEFKSKVTNSFLKTVLRHFIIWCADETIFVSEYVKKWYVQHTLFCNKKNNSEISSYWDFIHEINFSCLILYGDCCPLNNFVQYFVLFPFISIKSNLNKLKCLIINLIMDIYLLILFKYSIFKYKCL